MSTEDFLAVAPGVRLYYRRLGSKSGSTVVAPAAAWWGHQLDPLAEGHTLLLYDARGRGRSDPRPDSGVGPDEVIEDLEHLRRELQLGTISLIGWSYFGAAVALYAARYPQHVNRIVQVGPMVPCRQPYWDQFIADYLARATMPAAAAGWLPTIAPQLADPATAERILASVDISSPNEDPVKVRAWGGQIMSSLGDWDWRGVVAGVSAPVLTVHGLRDNLPIESSREWVRALPNARLLLIDGAGHYPHFEQPAVFIAALATFFRGAWPAEATYTGADLR
jgi:pimeloyl-ACP methyl ester carboxylesterase